MSIAILGNELAVVAVFFLLPLLVSISWNMLLLVCGGLAIFFPALFYHHSRSFWLAATCVLGNLDDWLK